jgi:hypothetical protein
MTIDKYKAKKDILSHAEVPDHPSSCDCHDLRVVTRDGKSCCVQ